MSSLRKARVTPHKMARYNATPSVLIDRQAVFTNQCLSLHLNLHQTLLSAATWLCPNLWLFTGASVDGAWSLGGTIVLLKLPGDLDSCLQVLWVMYYQGREEPSFVFYANLFPDRKLKGFS